MFGRKNEQVALVASVGSRCRVGFRSCRVWVCMHKCECKCGCACASASASQCVCCQISAAYAIPRGVQLCILQSAGLQACRRFCGMCDAFSTMFEADMFTGMRTSGHCPAGIHELEYAIPVPRMCRCRCGCRFMRRCISCIWLYVCTRAYMSMGARAHACVFVCARPRVDVCVDMCTEMRASQNKNYV